MLENKGRRVNKRLLFSNNLPTFVMLGIIVHSFAAGSKLSTVSRLKHEVTGNHHIKLNNLYDVR